MPVQRKSKRATLDEAASAGLIVRVSTSGTLEWIVPETSAEREASESAPVAAQSTLGAKVIADQEQAVIDANQRKLEHLRTLPDPFPDLADVVSDIMAMAHPPTLSLAVAGWMLQATGLIPAASAAAAVTVGGYVGRRLEHRLHSAQVPEEASETATALWQAHPGLASRIMVSLMESIIDGMKNAATTDDSELEDELDAYYPRWSRTDFEFDPRRYQS